MTQTPGTAAHIIEHERALNEAVARFKGVNPPNWLSDLLERASREDLDPVRLQKTSNVSDRPSSLVSEDRAPPPATDPQDTNKGKTATLVDFDGLQKELSKGVGDKKKDSSQNSWPDIAAALELTQKAAEALSVMEKRTTTLEAYALKAIAQARNELSAATARASSYRERAIAAEQVVRELEIKLLKSEERASRIEERAQRAEEEAQNAKTWLTHLNDVITNTLSIAIQDIGNFNSNEDIVGELEVKLKDGLSA